MLPNVGIIGTPDQIILISPILKSEGFPLTAIWCKNPDIARQLAAKLSISHCPPTFQDLLLLHDVDLVYVATEPVLQAEVAVKALTSGKHCICTKPPSISASEAEKMLLLAQYYSQLQTILDSHMRFIPCFRKLKRFIQDGHLGDVWAIDVQISMDSLIRKEPYSWKCDPSLGGGVLNLIGSHIIDLMCHLCPNSSKVERVNCLLSTFRSSTQLIHGYRTIEADDYCSLQLKYTNGIVGSVLINSHCESLFKLVLTVTGKEGRVQVHGMDLYWQRNGEEEKELFKEDLISEKELSQATELNLPAELYYISILGYRGMYKELRELFLMAADKSEKTLDSCLANFTDGHHLRTVLDCAYKSHKLGQWIDVPSSVDPPTNGSSTNPFWTSSAGVKIDSDKPSPKSNYPVSYYV